MVTAKQLDELLHKYGLGSIDLEPDGDFVIVNLHYDSKEDFYQKNFQLNDDGTFSLDCNGKLIFIGRVLEFHGEYINSETKELSLDNVEITDIWIESDDWAYPEGRWGIGENKPTLGIKLTDYDVTENFHSIDYVEKAIIAYLEPFKYKNWMLRQYVKETDIFEKKFYPILFKYRFREKYSSLMNYGFHQETEPYFEFTSQSNMTSIIVSLNMFTGRLVMSVYEENSDDKYGNKPYLKYDVNVNDWAEEQFEDYLLKKMEKTFVQDYEEAIKIKDNE